MGYAIPAYPHEHAGTAIVLGSAARAPHDLNLARARHPYAPIIGLNDVAKLMPLDHLYSLHYERLPEWQRYQVEHFGHRPVTHASEYIKKRRERGEFPEIDYWWVGTHCGGTSAWGAVRMAKMMGYSTVILAGCPLDGGGYCVEHTPNNDCKAVGAVPADDPMIVRYQRRIAEFVQGGEGVNVFSMSGWTRELLGAPL